MISTSFSRRIRVFVISDFDLGSSKLPAEGLEPTRSCDHWILSPARLPVPPRRHRFLHSTTTNEGHEADRKSNACKLRGGPNISRRIIALRKADGELNSTAMSILSLDTTISGWVTTACSVAGVMIGCGSIAAARL